MDCLNNPVYSQLYKPANGEHRSEESTLKWGFQPTQRTQRNERNERN